MQHTPMGLPASCGYQYTHQEMDQPYEPYGYQTAPQVVAFTKQTYNF